MKRQTILILVMALVTATVALAGVHTRSGKVYNQNSQFKEAVRELLLAIEEDPEDDEAYFQLGYAYSNLDSVALAYKYLMKAKELNPKKAKDVANNIQSNYARHYKVGQANFGRNNFTGAATEFHLATLADPSQSSAHYNLAVAYARLIPADSAYIEKTLVEADRVLELADPAEPNYIKALQLSARQLVALNRADEAVGRFTRYVEEDPSRFTVVEEIGNDLLSENRWAGAAAFLKMAADSRAKAGQDDFNVLFNIGVAEYNLGKKDPAHLDEAIVYYEKAMTISPDDANAAFNLMAVYVTKEDWAGAALWGEKYVSVSPSDPKGWQLLARCYGELGDDAKASEALNRYQQLKGQ